MKLKCDPLTIILIIGLFVSFGGGVLVGNVTAPKEINEYQYITQSQIQTQLQAQGQITIVGAREIKTVQIDIKGLTNITTYTITNKITNLAPNNTN